MTDWATGDFLFEYRHIDIALTMLAEKCAVSYKCVVSYPDVLNNANV